MANEVGIFNASNLGLAAVKHINGDFQGNDLDEYDSTTYNIKFFMISFEDEKAGNALKAQRTKIIAQSGVTAGIGIDDLVVSSIPAMTNETHTGVSTILEFKITQSLGADLLDQIHDYSAELGIANYQDFPFYVEVSFRGRNTDTGAESTDLSSTVWLWKIVINTVGITVNAGGSVYDFRGTVYDDIGYTNQYGTINQLFTVDASQVDDCFNKLATKFELRQQLSYSNTVSIPDKWEFKFEPIIGKEIILPQKDASSTARVFSEIKEEIREAGRGVGIGVKKGGEQTAVAFSTGTDIVRAIDAVLANTELIQRLAKKSRVPEGNPGSDTVVNKEEFKQLYRVYSFSEIIGFDDLRQRYARKYTYIVKLYDVSTLYQQTISKDTVLNDARLLFNRGYLQKRYDYIFTGLNDQVMDFNLNFDLSWYSALTNREGNLSTTNDQAQGPFLNRYSEAFKAAEKDLLAGRAANLSSTKYGANAEPEALDGIGIRTEYVTSGKPPNTTRGQFSVKTHEEPTSWDLMYGGVSSRTSDARDILSSMYTETKTPDMVTIDLKIKGDPYWLSPGPYSRNAKRLRTPNEEVDIAHARSHRSVAWKQKQGQVGFIFNCRTPSVGTSFEGDASSFKLNQGISGVYMVSTVESTFSGGMFTQELSCNRLMDVDPATIPNLLTRNRI